MAYRENRFETTCAVCGKTFMAGCRTAKYCTSKCKNKANAEMRRKRERGGLAPAKCVICGAEFKRSRTQKTCSPGCSSKLRKLRKREPATMRQHASKTLAANNEKARAEGLTYGMSKAKEWAEKHARVEI